MEFCGSISVSARYDTWGSARYYNFVAVPGIVVAVLVILFNLFKIVERLEKVPWMFIVFIKKKKFFCVCLLYLSLTLFNCLPKNYRSWYLMVYGLC